MHGLALTKTVVALITSAQNFQNKIMRMFPSREMQTTKSMDTEGETYLLTLPHYIVCMSK